jgi:hypothetical protein
VTQSSNPNEAGLYHRLLGVGRRCSGGPSGNLLSCFARHPASRLPPFRFRSGAVNVLIACECSGASREAFRARGHDAWSCDLQEAEDGSPYHMQRDCLDVIKGLGPDIPWDLMIAHPPCTYLSRAGARWWGTPERDALAGKAAEFVFALRDAPIRYIAIENPIGQLNRRWRYPDQTIQPYEFGHPYSKATCLWLKNLPPLFPTDVYSQYRTFLPSNVGAGRRKGQRSDPGVARNAKDASRTFPGIAEAMADQWGDFISRRLAA